MPKQYYRHPYWGNCVGSNGEDVSQMVADAVEVSWATFKKHVDETHLKQLIEEFGYYPHSSLRIHRDYAVSFYRSKYQGAECYYIYQSAIEWIFI